MALANPQKHLTDINEWRKMGDACIFPLDSRLELIDGEIFEMSPIGCNHAGRLNRIYKLLTILVKDQKIRVSKSIASRTAIFVPRKPRCDPAMP